MSLQFTKGEQSRFDSLMRLSVMEPLISSGNLQMLRWFRDEMGITWKVGDLMSAAANGQLEIVKYLENTGCEKHLASINYAIRGGHFDVVKYMVEKRYPSTHAMQYAIMYGRLDIMRYLHSHNIICDRRGALHAAEMRGGSEIRAWIYQNLL